jgi:hypothetical protein
MASIVHSSRNAPSLKMEALPSFETSGIHISNDLWNKNQQNAKFYINNLIIGSSTCFEHPSVHPQEDFDMQFYGISFMHPYKQPG